MVTIQAKGGESMNIPVEYWPQDFYMSTKTPSNVDLVNNATAAFYARYLLKRAMAAVDFTLPDEWSKTYSFVGDLGRS